MTQQVGGDILACQSCPEAARARPSDDDAADVAVRGIGQDRLADVAFGFQRGQLGAQPFGQPQGARQPVLVGLGQGLGPRLGDVERDPFGARPVGRAFRDPDRLARRGAFVDADEDALLRRPGPGNRVRRHVLAQLRVDPVGGGAQGQFAQRGQVALGEERGQGAGGLVVRIDLALLQPVHQFVGRQVDQLDLVGQFQHAVGNGFAHPHAGDAGDGLVQRLDVLDVQRGEDVDPRGQHLFDILPALLVPPAIGIGVGELVDQRQRRTAGQQAVEVHLGQRAALVDHRLAGQLRQPGKLGLGLGPAMGLDQGGQNIDALGPPAVRVVEHGPGLADPRRRADEDLQPAASFARCLRQQRVGRWANVGVRGHSVGVSSAPAGGIGNAASSARLVSSTFTRGSP